MSKYLVAAVTLGSAVGLGATFTANYPAGSQRDDFLGGTDHMIFTQTYRPLSALAGDFTVAFGASNITVTNTSGLALPVGTVVYLSLDQADVDPLAAVRLADPATMSAMQIVKINLGTPIASDPNGIVESQDLTTAGVFSVNTTAAAAIAAAATDGILDVPRNVVAAWTGTAVLTVNGTDVYGNAIRESSASGTTMTGRKAFKTVTSVTTSANITALTVGTAKVLGLPVFLGDLADVFREQQDGAAATAGTVVAADLTAASAVTGDVRGTYAPNGTPNGTLRFELIAAVRAPSYTGGAQFAG